MTEIFQPGKLTLRRKLLLPGAFFWIFCGSHLLFGSVLLFVRLLLSLILGWFGYWTSIFSAVWLGIGLTALYWAWKIFRGKWKKEGVKIGWHLTARANFEAVLAFWGLVNVVFALTSFFAPRPVADWLETITEYLVTLFFIPLFMMLPLVFLIMIWKNLRRKDIAGAFTALFKFLFFGFLSLLMIGAAVEWGLKKGGFFISIFTVLAFPFACLAAVELADESQDAEPAEIKKPECKPSGKKKRRARKKDEAE